MAQAAKRAARTSKVARHPMVLTSAWEAGTKIVDERPATTVIVSSASWRSRRNQVLITANAGSYRTAALASPIPTNDT